MKVKLVQGRLVVEEDKDDFLNITTPNGHMTKLCYLTAHIPVPPWRDPNDKQLHMSLKVAMDNYDFMNDVKTLIRSSAFGSYIACAPHKTPTSFWLDGWYDIASKTWIREMCAIRINPKNAQRLIERVEFDLSSLF